MAPGVAALAITAWAGASSCASPSEPMTTPDPRWEGATLRVDVPTVDIAAGAEITELCFSMDIGNEEPIYVSEVTLHGTTGIHHSNWSYVPSTLYPGPDGLWPCDERGFDQAAAAARGGVLFAQSTQVVDETMAFNPGAVLAIPAHSRIVANLHFVNWSPEALASTLQLLVRTVPVEEATTFLHGFAFGYDALAIPPRTQSEFTTECDVASVHEASLRRPLDFRIHYVLPHYHALGTHLGLQVIGGPHDGETIWEADSPIGEPLGGTLDPPFDMTGATGLRLTCRFDNPGDAEVHFGNGDGEMCIAFGYSDSPNLWASLVRTNEVVGVVDGVTMNTGGCAVVSTTPR